jgi:uncharacterized protein (TIGR03083 family)
VLLVRTTREHVFAAVANERRQIAHLIDDVDDQQLATPSLCAGWDVKTVAAHLVSVFADSSSVFMRTALRRRSMARAIDDLARRRAQLQTAEIAATLVRCADYPLSPPLFGPLDPLADILVHGGDMRIPLNLPFEPDSELAALALDFLTGPWPFYPERNLGAGMLIAAGCGVYQVPARRATIGARSCGVDA